MHERPPKPDWLAARGANIGSVTWLIQRGSAATPTAEFLFEPAQMAFEWTDDRSAARRFASKAEAEQFGRNFLIGPFNLVET